MGGLWSNTSRNVGGGDGGNCYVCCTNRVMAPPAYFCTEQSYPRQDAQRLASEHNHHYPDTGAFLVDDRGWRTSWPTRWPWGTLIQSQFIEHTTKWANEEEKRVADILAIIDAGLQVQEAAIPNSSKPTSQSAKTNTTISPSTVK